MCRQEGGFDLFGLATRQVDEVRICESECSLRAEPIGDYSPIEMASGRSSSLTVAALQPRGAKRRREEPGFSADFGALVAVSVPCAQMLRATSVL
jgi:hypothetical protein